MALAGHEMLMKQMENALIISVFKQENRLPGTPVHRTEDDINNDSREI
jgi:hypothetical protein